MSGDDGCVRVLVGEDHPLMLEAILNRLKNAEGIEVVAVARNGSELIDRYEESRPDVVLSDHSMPVLTGIDATRKILEADPSARVVVLSAFDEPSVLEAALAAGAAGYLIKTIGPDELRLKVLAAARGETVFDGESAKLAAIQIRATAVRPARRREGVLSAREVEVLALVSEGRTNAGVAAELFVSAETVKSHLDRIFTKLEVNDRAAAVKRAMQAGLL